MLDKRGIPTPTVALLTCLMMLRAQADSGIVPNGGFEASAGKFLAAWSLAPGFDRKVPDDPAGTRSDQQVVVVWQRGHAADGDRCLRMESRGESNSDFALVGSRPLTLVPGFRYRISFQYRAEGLMPEDARRRKYAAVIMDFFVNQRVGGRTKFLKAYRIITSTNTGQWAPLTKTFTMPREKNCWCQVRLQLVNKCPGNRVRVWFDDIVLLPLDVDLPNPGFEEGIQAPRAWEPLGAARTDWLTTITHSGRRAVSVADAGEGVFSGWATTLPIRSDRKYRFGGFVKARNLRPDGQIAGGVFCVQFLDNDGQVIGRPVVSPAVTNNEDWRRVATPFAGPPAGAVTARLIAGLRFCRGTAFFDDLFLDLAETELRPGEVLVKRKVPAPSPGVSYLPNLLKNGSVEQGENGHPVGWSYVGDSERDWTPAEIEVFHTRGYPPFSMGRGRGQWTTGVAYAGDHALLNVSIDPPLSSRRQWYGRGVVDGYWLSDPMPCRPGKAYLASAWLRPGAPIREAWLGPLEIRFYDANGRPVNPKNFVRSSLDGVPAGRWTFWATQPYVAPSAAATMRLRFGQELRANEGGWGRTCADNFAVWQLPDGARTENVPQLDTHRFMQWFFQVHQAVKPPYLPSPAEKEPYNSVWGAMENLVDGNVFSDPGADVPARFTIYNLLGETRTLRLRITHTDWLGNAGTPVVSKPFVVKGFSKATVGCALPPSRRFGAFHLDVDVLEGEAVMGRLSGRYAVTPRLGRPHTVENVWGVTPLVPLRLNGDARERELASLMKLAGFGVAWVRASFDPNDADKKLSEAVRVLRWYRSLGIRPVLQLFPRWRRPIEKRAYKRAGKRVGEMTRGLAVAVGDWGIEQANSESPFRGGGKERLTDNEYDTILAALYDGIKSVAPELPVLIGNIATDPEAKTIQRLYKPPAGGRFDGAIFNAYAGQLTVGRNMLREFDRHGDRRHTIWLEEMAEQRSPFAGAQRRYGEADGAKQMVRTWLTLYAKLRPRIKAVTMWGFVTQTAQDIMMVTPELQPRPQFVAHAVMSDALADAEFVADLSEANLALFKFQRPARRGFPPFPATPVANGQDVETLIAAWATAGSADVTFEAPSGRLAKMDLMGNCEALPVRDGIATVHLDTMPVYLIARGRLRLSKRVGMSIAHGATKWGKPALRVSIANNGDEELGGALTVTGASVAATTPQNVTLRPHKSTDILIPLKAGLPAGERMPFRAVFRTDAGAVFAASASLNFAFAVHVPKPPALEGTWRGWESAPVVTFGTEPAQICKPVVPGESYDGQGDIVGRFRLLWDNEYLYLGVEALDDAYVPLSGRCAEGFMGDSIEFAVQPQNVLSQDAVRYEFELYLPANANHYAASRRAPAPSAMVTHWRATVKPTRHRGDVIYQVALPWQDLGVTKPRAGMSISFALVLNDKDAPDAPWTGGRCRIRWFAGVDNEKNPERYGDVVLVTR